MKIFWACHHQTFDCPVGSWVIEQRAIILSATVRSHTVTYQIYNIAGCAWAGNAGTFSLPPWVSDPSMHHSTCVTHLPWCMPGSLTSGFLWSWWHSRRMCNPPFCVSGKRPIKDISPKLIFGSKFTKSFLSQPFGSLAQQWSYCHTVQIFKLWNEINGWTKISNFSNVINNTMASQVTVVSIVCSTVFSRKLRKY